MPRIEHCYRGGFQGRPGWWLAFAFDPDVIDRLKATIPVGGRSWDPDRGEWWVSADHEQALVTILPAFEAYLAQTALF